MSGRVITSQVFKYHPITENMKYFPSLQSFPNKLKLLAGKVYTNLTQYPGRVEGIF